MPPAAIGLRPLDTLSASRIALIIFRYIARTPWSAQSRASGHVSWNWRDRRWQVAGMYCVKYSADLGSLRPGSDFL